MKNKLAKAMAIDANATTTENGGFAISTTLDPVLDLFASIGSMRSRTEDEIIEIFEKAYACNPLLTIKCVFYARDIRGGLGERRTFRILLKHMAEEYPDVVRLNMSLIDDYGRYDDLYELIDTPVENEMWTFVKERLIVDIDEMKKGHPVSLLAKWLKTADASSVKTRQLGIYTAKKLGYSVYEYKRILRSLRHYLKIVETKMTANEWDNIDYSEVPSRAAMIYRNAFAKHDENRYNQYIEDVKSGKEQIHAATLYPYDILEQYANPFVRHLTLCRHVDDTIEELWKALPWYVDEKSNMLVMADVSGSMNGRPMATSVGLAIYFAERNHGFFENMFMTFSRKPSVVAIEGKTLLDKINAVFDAGVGYDTNIEAAFERLLYLATRYSVPQEDMPSAIIIISDMEFNEISDHGITSMLFYDDMKERYEECGYTIPHIVFWNVAARHSVFHATSDTAGVSMISGSSISSFKFLIDAIKGTTPTELMLQVLNSERYMPVVMPE